MDTKIAAALGRDLRDAIWLLGDEHSGEAADPPLPPSRLARDHAIAALRRGYERAASEPLLEIRTSLARTLIAVLDEFLAAELERQTRTSMLRRWMYRILRYPSRSPTRDRLAALELSALLARSRGDLEGEDAAFRQASELAQDALVRRNAIAKRARRQGGA